MTRYGTVFAGMARIVARLPALLAVMVAAMAVFTAVTGCSQHPADASKEKNTLHLFNWNNYITPETVKRFEQSCHCKLSQDYYSDNEEMLAKLAAGATGYDLIVPTGNAMKSLIRQDVLKPVDHSLLSNLGNINPAYLNTTFDPGNRYSVPYSYTITLIGYNQEKISQLGLPVNSWALIFEPAYLEKIKGRVTVLDSPRELMSVALKYLGFSANDTDPAHWEQAKNLIIRAKPYWAAFSNTSYIKGLATGNLWVVHGYSNDIFQAAQDALHTGRKFTIGYTIPEEGAVLSLDSMVLHTSGQQTRLAHQFINFMLDGRNAAELTNMTGSGNPNLQAMPYIRPDITTSKAIFPDTATLARLEMLQDLDHKQRRLSGRLWTEIRLR